MEIDLARVMRAVTHVGSALEEMRSAFRPGRAGVLRIHAEDKIVDLPIGLMAMGLMAALLIFSMQRRRERTDDPISLSWQHARERPPA
jgi:hypothetical protein